MSTTDQNLDLQLDALEKAGCQRIYQDKLSGKLASRPDLERLLAALQVGDSLVVWKLDRLGRSLAHTATVLADLTARGVTIKSLQDGMDSSTIQGRAMIQMAGVFAEMEREFIRERTQAGLTAARARGRRGGRRTVMNSDRLAIAKRMDAEGKSPSVIAKTLGVGRATIYRHLGKAG